MMTPETLRAANILLARYEAWANASRAVKQREASFRLDCRRDDGVALCTMLIEGHERDDFAALCSDMAESYAVKLKELGVYVQPQSLTKQKKQP